MQFKCRRSLPDAARIQTERSRRIANLGIYAEFPFRRHSGLFLLETPSGMWREF